MKRETVCRSRDGFRGAGLCYVHPLYARLRAAIERAEVAGLMHAAGTACIDYMTRSDKSTLVLVAQKGEEETLYSITLLLLDRRFHPIDGMELYSIEEKEAAYAVLDMARDAIHAGDVIRPLLLSRPPLRPRTLQDELGRWRRVGLCPPLPPLPALRTEGAGGMRGAERGAESGEDVLLWKHVLPDGGQGVWVGNLGYPHRVGERFRYVGRGRGCACAGPFGALRGRWNVSRYRPVSYVLAVGVPFHALRSSGREGVFEFEEGTALAVYSARNDGEEGLQLQLVEGVDVLPLIGEEGREGVREEGRKGVRA